MRAFFVVLSVSFLTACQTDSNVGEGPLELSPQVAAGYEKFKKLDNPGYFAVPPDGSAYGYSYCPEFGCRGQSPSIALNSCNRGRPLNDCKIYAHKDKVLWQFPDGQAPGERIDGPEDPGRGLVELSTTVTYRLREWEKKPNPSYFAISDDGLTYGFTYCSRGGCADRLQLQTALHRCATRVRDSSKTDRPCRIYGRHGKVVWRFPNEAPAGFDFKTASRTLPRSAIEGQSLVGDKEITGSAFLDPDLRFGALELRHWGQGVCRGLIQRTYRFGGTWELACDAGGSLEGAYNANFDGTELIGSGTDGAGRQYDFRVAIAAPGVSFQALAGRGSPRPLGGTWKGVTQSLSAAIFVSVEEGRGAIHMHKVPDKGDCNGVFGQTYDHGGEWSVRCADGEEIEGTYRLTESGTVWNGFARDAQGRRITLEAKVPARPASG